MNIIFIVSVVIFSITFSVFGVHGECEKIICLVIFTFNTASH